MFNEFVTLLSFRNYKQIFIFKLVSGDFGILTLHVIHADYLSQEKLRNN